MIKELYYFRHSYQQIADILNSSAITIANIIKKYQYKQKELPTITPAKPPHKYVDTLFRTLPLSASESYLLGYITSDGNITKNRIVVASKDNDIMYKLYTFMPNAKLYISTQANKNFYIVSLCNQRIVNKLLEFGITENKSLTIEMPLQKLQYIQFNHYLRAVFEGDGHISKQTESNGYLIGITSGSYPYLQQLSDIINFYIPGLTKYSISEATSIKNHNCFYQLRYYTKNADKILHYMYDNANNLYMERKRKKAFDCLNRVMYAGYQ